MNRPAARISPSKLIRLLRESDPVYMRNLYCRGACFHLYRILRVVWPDAEPWFDDNIGHVYTRIGARWYDIEGHLTARQIRKAKIRLMTTKERKDAPAWLEERFRQHGFAKMCRCR